jgi:hypothetical protein
VNLADSVVGETLAPVFPASRVAFVRALCPMLDPVLVGAMVSAPLAVLVQGTDRFLGVLGGALRADAGDDVPGDQAAVFSTVVRAAVRSSWYLPTRWATLTCVFGRRCSSTSLSRRVSATLACARRRGRAGR